MTALMVPLPTEATTVDKKQKQKKDRRTDAVPFMGH